MQKTQDDFFDYDSPREAVDWFFPELRTAMRKSRREQAPGFRRPLDSQLDPSRSDLDAA